MTGTLDQGAVQYNDGGVGVGVGVGSVCGERGHGVPWMSQNHTWEPGGGGNG